MAQLPEDDEEDEHIEDDAAAGSDEDAEASVDDVEEAESAVSSENANSEDESVDEKQSRNVRVATRKTRPRKKRKQRGSRGVVISEEDEEEDDDEPEMDDVESEDEDEETNEWDAGDEAAEEGDIRDNENVRCIYCGQDEEHDPAAEYEEILACAVCGDNSHRQCAREDKSLATDEDAIHWRCRDCVTHGLVEEVKDVAPTTARRRNSAPRMARDLLPAARGGIKPDSHSVFNNLILDEDPMDGSRALRKRKTPDEDRKPDRKRQRTGSVRGSSEVVEEVVDGAPSEAASPRPFSNRPLRPRSSQGRGARIVFQSDEPKSAIIAIAVTVSQWDEIERNVIKKQKRRERDRLRRIRNQRARTHTVEVDEVQHFPAVQTTMYTNPFYAFPDRETDELKGKPYGGILNEAEADTSRTYPQDNDRKAFQDARDHAEEKWKEKIASTGETPARPPKTSGLPSKIKCINFGSYEIDTWHAAPYPEEYSRNKHLYICEFCLKYMSSDYVAWRHKLKCSAKHPPGDEIYRSKITNPETGTETHLSFFEVDGRRNPLYCQNLCLLAKLFLGSKTLYYDVEPFLFYIMTENDEFGCHFVGYFSKEKRGCGPPLILDHITEDRQGSMPNGTPKPSTSAVDAALANPGNNVSCILVLPVHMRRGFGRVLIEFSYLLTKVEGRTGSPEKPLSDMGLVSYRSYWRGVICQLLLRYKDQDNNSTGTGPTSVAHIARETGMTPDDIISTLEALRFLVRDPITRRYALRLDYDYMKEYVEKHEKKATIKLDPDRLCWTPYVMGRPTNLFTMGEEANQPVQTVQPRNDDSMLDTQMDVVPDEAESIAETTETPQTNGVSRDITPDVPTLAPNMSTATSSPTHQSPHKTPNGSFHNLETSSAGTSYYSSSQPDLTGPIPPTRFEVFPPVPGMLSAARRKPGRPARGSSRRNTSYRTATYRRPASGRRRKRGSGRTAGTMRRTRSKLSEVATIEGEEAVQEDVEDNQEDMEEQNDENVAEDDAEDVVSEDDDDEEMLSEEE